jgi:beta-N-acetylhexosaminidase
MAIGASGFPRDALMSGYYIGREISAIGINMNFAPTVDLFTKRDSVLIGPRAFGDDPVQTAILGAAFAKGLERSGVIATAKHFPGHGDTELDSHTVLPSIDSTESMLWERELIPYRLLAKEGIPAIMSGHIAFPRTPAGWEPASLSKWFLTDLLRDKLGYKGLVITDDLLMNGATMSAGSLSRAARLALEAGNDVILLSSTPLLDDPVWVNLLFAYKNEKAFRTRVREAALRNLTLKLDYLRRATAPPLVPDLKTLADKVPDLEGRQFFLGLAARSVTKMGNGKLPIETKPDERILIAGQFDEFIAAGKTAYPKANSYRFSYLPFDKALPEEKDNLVRLAGYADTVIICVANPASLELLQSLKELGKRVVVISSLTPVYMDKALWVDTTVAVYSYAKESFIAGFSALSGSIPAPGKIPFAPLKGSGKAQGQ